MPDPAQRPDPEGGSTVTRLWRGAAYLWLGWRLIRRHPPLLRLSLAPVVAGLLTFGSCLALLFIHLPEVAQLVWSRPHGKLLLILWTALEIVIFSALLVVGLALSYVVQCSFAAPFNDLISERVERLLLEGGPPRGSWADAARSAGRAMAHQARKGLLWLGAAVPLFLLGLIVPGIGTLIWTVGSFYLTVRFVAYDSLDYSMGRRGWVFSRKVAFLRNHRAVSMGLGVSTTLLLFVPILGLTASPLAAAGGTALFCDIARHRQS